MIISNYTFSTLFFRYLPLICIAVTILIPILCGNPINAKANSLAQKEKSMPNGDEVVDGVLKNLEQLEKNKTLSESTLIDVLRPLFSRAAFYDAPQTNWGYFIYSLSKTKIILEKYKIHFTAKQKENVEEIIQIIGSLQKDVAKIYGASFSIEEHLKKYTNRNAFVQNLPAQQHYNYQQLSYHRNNVIGCLREKLYKIGLTDSF